MKEYCISKIDAALKLPELLGTVERNTEAKIVYLTLLALGWDPITEIASNFHIDRMKFSPHARSARAADFGLGGMRRGILVVGEVKKWGVTPQAWGSGRSQIEEYSKALGNPRAFLSCGHTWIVWDESFKPLIQATYKDPRTSKKPHGALLAQIDSVGQVVEFTTALQLVGKLEDHIGREAVTNGGQEACDRWKYGINPSSKKRSRADSK